MKSAGPPQPTLAPQAPQPPPQQQQQGTVAEPARRPSTLTGNLTAAVVGVLGLWAVAVALVGIGGEFPLSDDWGYAHVVRSLCDGRGFDFLPWTGASLVLQALYGAAACKLTGFSHEGLRATTLVLSAIGIAVFHALLRSLGANKSAAAAGAAVLAFSPLWFNLSFTFMTDVPFAVFALAATWLYVRALGNNSRSGLLLAGAVAAASFLVRQHGLSIAVAAAIAAWWPLRGDPSSPPSEHAGPASLKARIADAAAALALPFVVAAAYALWVATAADVPLAVHNKVGEAASTSLLAIAGAAFRGLATLGFLFVPWALTMRLDGRGERRVFAGTFAALAGVAAMLYAHEGASMFYLTNVLGDLHVGAVTTRDVQFLSDPGHETGVGSAYVAHAVVTSIATAVITAMSLLSAATLVARLGAALPRFLPGAASPHGLPNEAQAHGVPNTAQANGRSNAAIAGARPALFCLLALALSGLGTLAQAHYYFDRYLIVLLPLAVASVVAVSPPARISWAMGTALAALAAYAIAGTHDYMEWNRARWQLLAILESAGVPPQKIDGGVEYNAERLAALLRTAPTDAQARSGQPASTKSWWWVVDDEWIIAFRPLDGYVEVDSCTFTRWLPPGEGQVLTLRREGWPKCGEGSNQGAGNCAPTDLSTDKR